jgi:hypothetical protein
MTEGDIPSSPEHLLLISEESSVESGIQDLGDTNPPGTIPAQEIVGCNQADPTPL